MDKEIKILIVEDTPSDAELIARELGKGDLAHTTKWVKARQEYLRALQEFVPDIILCDYRMSGFDALEAFEISKKRSPEIPFIVVSGTIGEDSAVEMMKLGVVDYVMKNNLPKLALAIKRALKEAQAKVDFKRMEREVERAKEIQFKTLIENLPGKVFIKDRNSAYITCNESYAKDLGIKSEEVAGKTDYHFFPTHLAEKYRADDRSVIESGQTKNVEEEYATITDYLGNSQTNSINTVKVPIRDDAGNVVGVLGFFWDITERKRMEEEKLLSEAQAVAAKAKTKFAAIVSHELRSPLAVIQEAVSLVMDGVMGNVSDEQKDCLGIAKKNTDRLGRLINNVLDFQKIDAGKMEFDIRGNDLNEVVAEVHKHMSVLTKKKGLDLRLELEEALPQIKFDRDKLFQVFMNLVSNAIANTEAGSVTLSIQKENEVVHARVRDTGAGISDEDLPRLFQPFEQLACGRGKQKGGTGLGLAITKEIILAHHGKIWAESEPGKGSTFHFVLPLQDRRA